MKKIVLLLIFIMSINTTACQLLGKKEFSQLPKYENMEQVDFQEAETPEGLDKAIYTLDNTTAEDFLNEYEKKMHAEGWTTTNDNKPVSIDLKKDNQITVVVVKPTNDDNTIEVNIFSNAE
ncbi:MAG: hypothetical protein ACOYVK_17070 [Bacillota bacterium]